MSMYLDPPGQLAWPYPQEREIIDHLGKTGGGPHCVHIYWCRCSSAHCRYRFYQFVIHGHSYVVVVAECLGMYENMFSGSAAYTVEEMSGYRLISSKQVYNFPVDEAKLESTYKTQNSLEYRYYLRRDIYHVMAKANHRRVLCSCCKRKMRPGTGIPVPEYFEYVETSRWWNINWKLGKYMQLFDVDSLLATADESGNLDWSVIAESESQLAQEVRDVFCEFCCSVACSKYCLERTIECRKKTFAAMLEVLEELEREHALLSMNQTYLKKIRNAIRRGNLDRLRTLREEYRQELNSLD